jgi:hypothetical protein
MSQENVEIVRRAFEEVNRGGVEALIDSFWAPEIVLPVVGAIARDACFRHVRIAAQR